MQDLKQKQDEEVNVAEEVDPDIPSIEHIKVFDAELAGENIKQEDTNNAR